MCPVICIGEKLWGTPGGSLQEGPLVTPPGVPITGGPGISECAQDGARPYLPGFEREPLTLPVQF